MSGSDVASHGCGQGVPFPSMTGGDLRGIRARENVLDGRRSTVVAYDAE